MDVCRGGGVGVKGETTETLRLAVTGTVVKFKRTDQFLQSHRIEGAPPMDVGFRPHHGLETESPVTGSRVHAIYRGRGKRPVGSIQVELRALTLLLREREGSSCKYEYVYVHSCM